MAGKAKLFQALHQASPSYSPQSAFKAPRGECVHRQPLPSGDPPTPHQRMPRFKFPTLNSRSLAPGAQATAGKPRAWRALAALTATLLACGLASQGGWLALAGSLCGAAACALLARTAGASEQALMLESTKLIDDRLPRAVVPVWRQQLLLARQASDDNIAQLLEGFATLSGELDQAVAALTRITPDDTRDFVENVLSDNESNVKALSEPIRDTRAAKRTLAQQIGQIVGWMADLHKLGAEVRAVAKHTNLVAVNASIEAHRASVAGRNFAVVAEEVRTLAQQSSQAGERIQHKAKAIDDSVRKLKNQLSHESDSDEAILLEAENHTRQVMAKLLGSASHMADSSRQLRDTSHAVQQKIEALMMALQHQDRLSQMLTSITNDMERFETWLDSNEGSSPGHAADWLQRLEHTYTTQEQRSSHHGTKTVAHASGVDFF